jgi:hypothetical protein
MLDDAEIETSRPPRAAINYLIASGAAAITITADVDGASITVGTKIDPNAAAIFWLPANKARSIAMKARTIAGDNPDTDEAIRALHAAAAKSSVTLTPHHVAIPRASEIARRLDDYIESLHARGAMRQFTKTYKVMRLAAKQRGEGFMSFKAAEARLRKALIPLLMNGGQPVAGASLFAQIFSGK